MKYQHYLHFPESLQKSSNCICVGSPKQDHPTKEEENATPAVCFSVLHLILNSK